VHHRQHACQHPVVPRRGRSISAAWSHSRCSACGPRRCCACSSHRSRRCVRQWSCPVPPARPVIPASPAGGPGVTCLPAAGPTLGGLRDSEVSGAERLEPGR